MVVALIRLHVVRNFAPTLSIDQSSHGVWRKRPEGLRGLFKKDIFNGGR